jgi:hypothetical protein
MIELYLEAALLLNSNNKHKKYLQLKTIHISINTSIKF